MRNIVKTKVSHDYVQSLHALTNQTLRYLPPCLPTEFCFCGMTFDCLGFSFRALAMSIFVVFDFEKSPKAKFLSKLKKKMSYGKST